MLTLPQAERVCFVGVFEMFILCHFSSCCCGVAAEYGKYF
jgi:hypothetical protein